MTDYSKGGGVKNRQDQQEFFLHFLLCFQSFTAEVEKIIKNMANKAGGWDLINAKTLKCMSPFVSGILAYIFNLCLDTGIWPANLKGFHAVLILKGRT